MVVISSLLGNKNLLDDDIGMQGALPMNILKFEMKGEGGRCEEGALLLHIVCINTFKIFTNLRKFI